VYGPCSRNVDTTRHGSLLTFWRLTNRIIIIIIISNVNVPPDISQGNEFRVWITLLQIYKFTAESDNETFILNIHQ